MGLGTISELFWEHFKFRSQQFTTTQGAGYHGVTNPKIRCSDLPLATAEDISLGLSLCGRLAVV